MRHRIILTSLLVFALAGCGKKEEEKSAEKQEENVVTLTKENLQHVEIKTELVAPGSIETTLRAAGRVTENQNKTARVSSTLEGRLLKANVDLNDQVKAGDVLGLVQTPELLGRPLELKAPIDGVVMDRKASAGELVGKEKEIFTISDPADLWVIAEIKERDIGAVKVGQAASFTVLAYPGETFRGKIVRIANVVETESRTVEARIEVNNADGRLKPGMFADVEIVTTVLENVIVIPDTALQTEEDNQIVFVALDTNKFQKRIVKLGLEHQGRVQILEGVKKGENVVTDGSFILKSEMLKGEMEAD
ncbi:MAG TPA: efflux RND transporter periplasmic adaptor subunit [Chthoniobacterales bacterium]|nr:efflux RND transporter periplasmic adaptor subunit [Chthoniobacterales bacterium]